MDKTANEIMADGYAAAKDAWARARECSSIMKKLGPTLKATGDSELLKTVRGARRHFRLMAASHAIGLVIAIPFYLLNRGMETIGVMPSILLCGAPFGIFLWMLVGDRASPLEFMAFTLGTGMVLISIAFIWSYNTDKEDNGNGTN